MAHLVPDFKQPLPPEPPDDIQPPQDDLGPFQGVQQGQLGQVLGNRLSSRNQLRGTLFDPNATGQQVRQRLSQGQQTGNFNINQFGDLLPQFFRAQLAGGQNPLAGDELEQQVQQKLQGFTGQLRQLQTQLRNPNAPTTLLEQRQAAQSPFKQLGGLLGLRLF